MNNHRINTEKNRIDYEQKNIVLNSYPQIVFIETTRNCNLKCPMCERAQIYGNKNNTALNMSKDALQKIAHQIFSHVEIVDFHGNGEFLCYPYFHAAMQLARSYKCRIRTVTNLITVDKSRLDSLLEEDVILCISIDSPYAEQYEALRLGASFDVLCNNLEYISKANKTDVSVMMTLAGDNIHSITDMLLLLKKYQIHKLCIWNRYMSCNDSNNIIHHMKAAKHEFSTVFALAKEYGIEIRLLAWPEFDKSQYSALPLCVKPWMSIHINYDGSIGMCDFNETPEMLQGMNLLTKSFEEIWNSQPYQKLRTSFSSKKYIPFCSDCCIDNRFVDFEDILYPAFEDFVVGNFKNKDVVL